MPELIFVLGATNAGKTTLVAAAGKQPLCGLVEVGKLFRAKYPPEYFQGSAAPAHTRQEAIQLMTEGIQKSIDAGNRFTFVDGQPRDLSQVEAVFRLYPEGTYRKHFWNVYAPPAVREARARKRDEHNPKALELSLARLAGDIPPLYEAISQVTTALGETFDGLKRFMTIDTGRPSYDPEFVLAQFLGS